jgi:cbb3-type cytochrome oxidase maturation protein
VQIASFFKSNISGDMKIMLLLILMSLLLAAGFLLVYLWAARDGQFDDDYTPAVRILFDDTPKATKEEKT